jgi:uncharacterized protein YfaP (DUF2135 family)
VSSTINWAAWGTTVGTSTRWTERKRALPEEHRQALREFYVAFRDARSDNMLDNWTPADETEARVEFAIAWSRNHSDHADLQQVLNAVYMGAVGECEEREHKGTLTGNGHHMAQKIVERVKAELIRRKLFTEET